MLLLVFGCIARLILVRYYTALRGGSRTAATSKMEPFVIIVNGWKPLTIITKSSILDVAAALDPPLAPYTIEFPLFVFSVMLYLACVLFTLYSCSALLISGHSLFRTISILVMNRY